VAVLVCVWCGVCVCGGGGEGSRESGGSEEAPMMLGRLLFVDFESVFVCVCVCMCVYVCVCVCCRQRRASPLFVYMCICLYMHMFIHVCIYMCVFMYIYMYVYIHVCMWGLVNRQSSSTFITLKPH
jgi:nuclear pore complex protein Nup62